MAVTRKVLSSTTNAQLVSTSKFRHMNHEVQNKTNVIGGIQLGPTCDPTFCVSSKFFALPWKTVGESSFYVGSLNKYEKIAPKPKVVKAHSSPISTIQFSPFNDNMLMTGSKDCTVKLWQIEDNCQLDQITSPLVTINHASRLVQAQFHPLAEGILSTMTDDGIVQIYDIARPDEVAIELKAVEDGLVGMQWEGGYGRNLMTLGKDLNYRLYDPRIHAEPIASFCVSESVKGLKGLFLDGSDYFITSGFSRGGDRIINLFDQRKEGLLGRSIIDKQPHPLNVYFDDNNNLLYLTGKGNSMFVYEVQGKNMINLKTTNIMDGVSGCAMIPQRTYDVKKCEIGKFLILNQKSDTLFNVSYYLNRKDSDQYYQEDLYQNIKGTKPDYTTDKWFEQNTEETKMTTSKRGTGSKYNADIKKRTPLSLKPEGMTSIFEIKVDEGGRDRAKELLDQINKSSNKKKKMKKIKYSGAFEEVQRGWIFNSYIPRWFEMNEKYLMFFTNRDDAKPTTTIYLTHIKSFTASSAVGGKIPITIELEEECTEVKEKKALPKYTYFVQTENDAYEWIVSYKILRTLYEEKLEKKAKEEEERKQMEEELKNEKPKTKTKEEIKKERESKYETCGNVYMIKKTMFGTIKRKFIYIEKGVLYSQNVTWWGQQPTGIPEMECFLNRIIHLSKSEGIFPASYKEYTFQLTTKGNVFHFACDNEKDMEKWMKACTPNSLKREDEDEGLSDFTQTPAQEGMQYFFPGLFGGYSNVFVSLVANEIFIFKNKTDTNPLVKIYLQEIEKIEINKETEELIIFMEMKDKKVIQHKFKTSEYAIWKDEILDRKKRTLDLLTELGIRDKILSLDNTILEENVNKEALEADSLFLDTNKFIKGEPEILLQIKGRKITYPYLIPVNQEELNPCNSYVLINKDGLYSWQGQFAPKTNSARAVSISEKIGQKERNRIKPESVEHKSQKPTAEIFKRIGCKVPPFVKTAKKFSDLPNPEEYKNVELPDDQDKSRDEIIRIYRIVHNENNENNPLQITMVHENSVNVLPPKELLKKGSCSIITTSTEIYIWQSTSSTTMGRRVASVIAAELAKKINPLLMLKLNENGEFFLFKLRFSNYRDTLPIDLGSEEDIKIKQTERRPQREMDVMIDEIEKKLAPNFTEILFSSNSKAIFDAMTEGTYIVKRVEDHNLVSYPEELRGHFFTKEAFFIQYSFYPEGSDKQQHILYFWQGRDASVMDMGTLARKVVEQSGNLETSCQVRVTQGKEPEQFLKIFKGKFIVHLGAYSEYFKGRPEVYEIRGKEEQYCHMTQMTLPNQLQTYKSGMKLMPSSIYMFKTLKEIVVLKGKYANKAQEKAVEIASQEFNLPIVYGKEEIAKEMIGSEIEWINDCDRSAQIYNQLRIFKFTFWITAVDIEEIEQANQRDLSHENVYMIDSGKIWLWFGNKSQERFEVRKYAVEFALKYAQMKGQNKVMIETQNEESVEFRAAFEAWGNTDLLRKNNLRQEYPMCKPKIIETIKSIEDGTFKQVDPSLINDIMVEGTKIKSLKETTEMLKFGNVEVDRSLIFPQIEKRQKITEEDASEKLKEYTISTYSYAKLISKPRPYGIDSSRMETYLSDEEFEEVFNMKREEFNKLKKWTQDKLKRAAYLY